MNEKKKIAFLPFHAINEFMRNEYRLTVIRNTLLALPELERELAGPVDSLTKRHVKVPGFRNSAKAPATVKAVAMVKPFEKEPKLVSAILQAWSQVNATLRQQAYDLLTGRGWKIFPPDFDRRKLPGFLTDWPAEEDYETIYDAYAAAYPESEYGIDDLSLMIVWLAGRLPLDKVPMAELSGFELGEESAEPESDEDETN
ncbi:MAG: hypothetical protein JW862_01965 [Anaerolineales bacterium]|nr:hypothetical protein [Anaerolineales bacterium]